MVVIVGGGIAGLAAGCYARMNGYGVKIFEMNSIPGGLCTSWQRKNYLFDGCVETLTGVNPNTRWNQMWRELGVTQGRTFVKHDELLRINGPDGKTLTITSNLDSFEAQLLELAPDDAAVIREFTGAVRGLAKLDPPLDTDSSGLLGDPLEVRRWNSWMNKYKGLTLEGFAHRFKDPFLRKAFPQMGPAGAPLSSVLVYLAQHVRGNLGSPMGGSTEFAEAMAKRFCDLGGEISYQSRVERIVVDASTNGHRDRASGVTVLHGKMASGMARYHADWVVSAADHHQTLYRLLEGKYLNDGVANRFEQMPVSAPEMQISFGLKSDLSAEPFWQVDLFSQSMYFAGHEQNTLSYYNYSFDPASAPKGHSVLIARIPSDYHFWINLADSPTRYEAEKMTAGESVVSHLESCYPGFAEQIETFDITTPLTYERYTRAYHGTHNGFALTPKTSDFISSGLSPEIPGLEGCYQIGMWLHPNGGMFPAARSGREIIKKLCKLDGRRFVTSEP